MAGPSASRNALAQSANKVVQWVRREEERVFIIGGAVSEVLRVCGRGLCDGNVANWFVGFLVGACGVYKWRNVKWMCIVRDQLELAS